MIDESPAGSFQKAIDLQTDRDRRNAAIIAKNEKIIAMARKGASIHEIMTATGMGKNYVRRIAGSDLNEPDGF